MSHMYHINVHRFINMADIEVKPRWNSLMVTVLRDSRQVSLAQGLATVVMKGC